MQINTNQGLPQSTYDFLSQFTNQQPPQQHIIDVKQNTNQQYQYQLPQNTQISPFEKYNISQSSHPIACIFHMLFKSLGLLFYLIVKLFISSLQSYEIVIILHALDFWTVKNVTGRLLVGLRWWSEVGPDGILIKQKYQENDNWVFECKVNENLNSPYNERLFWLCQISFFLIWLIFSIINALALDISNLVVCVFASLALGINLFAYYKCSRGEIQLIIIKVQKQRIEEFTQQFGVNLAMQVINQQLSSSMKMPLNFGTIK